MTATEKEILEGLAILKTNQEVTQTHVKYIKEKIKKIEDKLSAKQEKDLITDKKVAALEEKTKCLPELKKEVIEISVDRKRRWKLAYLVFGAVVGLSAITFSLTQSCSIEKFSTQSATRAHIDH